jgi:hypothetical protein
MKRKDVNKNLENLNKQSLDLLFRKMGVAIKGNSKISAINRKILTYISLIVCLWFPNKTPTSEDVNELCILKRWIRDSDSLDRSGYERVYIPTSIFIAIIIFFVIYFI